jgi:hypothetical protein
MGMLKRIEFTVTYTTAPVLCLRVNLLVIEPLIMTKCRRHIADYSGYR